MSGNTAFRLPRAPPAPAGQGELTPVIPDHTCVATMMSPQAQIKPLAHSDHRIGAPPPRRPDGSLDVTDHEMLTASPESPR
jgi:hypothetical protein